MGLKAVSLFDIIGNNIKLNYPSFLLNVLASGLKINIPNPSIGFICNPEVDTYKFGNPDILRFTIFFESKYGNL